MIETLSIQASANLRTSSLPFSKHRCTLYAWLLKTSLTMLVEQAIMSPLGLSVDKRLQHGPQLLGANDFHVLSPSRTSSHSGSPLLLSRQLSYDILSKLLPTFPIASPTAATCYDILHITLLQCGVETDYGNGEVPETRPRDSVPDADCSPINRVS